MSKKDLNYTIAFSADIDEAAKSLKTLSQGLSQLNKGVKTSGVQDGINQIERALDRLNEKAMAPINSIGAFESIKKDKIKILASLKDIGNSITELEKLADDEKLSLLPKNEQQRIKTAISLAQDYARFLREATAQKKEDLKILKESLAESTKRKNEAKANLENAKTTKIQREGMIANHRVLIEQQSKEVEAEKEKLAILEKQVEALKKLEATKEAYEKAGADKTQEFSPRKGIVKNYTKDEEAARAALGERFGQATVAELQKEIGDVKAILVPAEKELTGLINTQAKWTKELNAANSEIAVYEKSLDKASKEISANEKALNSLNDELATSAYKQMAEEARKLGGAFANWPLDYTEQNLRDLETALADLKKEGVTTANVLVNTLKGQFNGLSGSGEKLSDKINQSATELERMDEVARNTEAFASRVKQFVGFTGGIELVRAATRNAISTVRELDAAMTEMAVVTNLGVGDYWEQLPEYTDRANKLGVSIKSAYESATLFYQQGLKTNEVVAMSNESLKLMRIAGLGAEDATNKMTAALRGFSMELSEVSAQRITDVYSELAAITAADVDEIATAMTKTASIASSAGMEFETTAAFLAQTIEATRESADAVGTSLKTVIARFQELKKDPSMIGEVDGEVVDANKIETALRSVGVALRDTNGQFRDLDQVFLDLSGKWGDLDTNTQRYIATVAAGSRQQSRFIAMISNYGRTQELVNAANTSAGASNRQYEKTLESLASKLERLKNAWDSFTMDLANSKIIKGAVDLFTELLTVINKVTNAFGKGSGLAKIGLIASALYIGDKALNAFTTSLKGNATVLQSLGAVATGTGASMAKDFEAVKRKLEDVKIAADAAKIKINDLKNGPKNIDAKKITESIKKEVEAYKKAEEIKQKNFTTTQEYYEAQNDLSEAINESKQAQKDLAKAYNLTDDQLEEVIRLVKLGMKADEAAIAITDDKTRAYLKQRGALDDLANEEERKIAQDAVNNFKRGMDTGTFEFESLDRIQMFFTKMQNFQWSDLTDKIGKTFGAMKEGAINAGKQLKALWASAGPLIIAVAALALAIFGLVKYLEYLKKVSPEGKLKTATEAAESATEAVEKLSTAYDELNNSLDTLEDKYDSLKDLAKGTREWKKTVREVNTEVSGLIDKYPTLVSAFERNEDGVLVIKQGQEYLVEQAQKQAEQALASAEVNKALAQNAVAEAEKNVAYSELSNNAKYGGQALQQAGEIAGTGTGAYLGAGAAAAIAAAAIATFATGGLATPALIATLAAAGVAGGIGGGIAGNAITRNAQANEKMRDQEYTEMVAKAMASGDIKDVDNADEVIKFLRDKLGDAVPEYELKTWGSSLADSSDELKKFGEQLLALEAKTEAYNDSLKQMILDNSNIGDEAGYAKDWMKTVAKSDAFLDVTKGSVKKELYSHGKSYTFTDEDGNSTPGFIPDSSYITEQIKKYYESLGYIDIEVTSESISYKVDENAEAVSISREGAINSYIDATATKVAAEQLNKLPEAIRKARGVTSKTNDFESLLEGTLSLQEVFAQTPGNYEKSVMEVYEAMGELGEEVFGSAEGFYKVYNDILSQQKAEAQVVADILSEKGFGQGSEIYGAVSKMGIEAASAYINKFTMVLGASGEQAAADLTKQWNILVANLSQEQRNELTAQLSAVDWSDSNAIDAFADSLKDMGLNIPVNDTNEFINKLKEVAHSIEKVNFDKMLESIGALQILAQEISSGVRGREFTAEEYQEIIDNNKAKATDFALSNAGKYIYLGSSMTDFAEALASTPESGIRAHQQGVAMGEYLNKVFASDEITVGGLGSLTESQQRALVKDLQKNFGDSLNGVIAGFSKTTKFEDLPDDFFSETGALQNFIAIARGGGDYSRLIQTLSAAYQNEEAALNAREILSGYKGILGGEAGAYDKAAFQARNKAFGIQAVAAGVDESLISSQARAFELLQQMKDYGKEGTDEYQKLLEIFEELTAEMGNAAAALQLEKGFSQAISTMKEGIGEVVKLEDGYLKDTKLASLAETMGINLTGANREYKNHIQNLIQTMTSGGEDAYQAYQNLMAESAKAMDASFENLGDLAYSRMDSATKEFVDRMVDLGMGRLEQKGKESHFEWISKDMFAAVQQASNATLKEWSKTYNWLYDAEAKVNTLIRERERLEREYSRVIEANANMTTQQIANNISAQIQALKTEREIAEGAVVKANNEIASLISSNSKFSQYVGYDQASGAVYVDYERLQSANFTEGEQQEFSAFISEISEWANVVEDNKDTIEENTDAIDKLRKSGIKEYSDLLDRVRDALIQSYQDQIDELSNINDSIKEAQSSLVEVMQDMISEQRQARENDKTESEIADKEARLAYLKRDTSGSNAMEIANLQKEISEAKQGYTDTLIDQALTDIADANEKAAEQREQQIALAQTQLDIYSESKKVWDQVQAILETSLGDADNFVDSWAGKLLEKYEPAGLNPVKTEEWKDALGTSGKLASIATNMGIDESGHNEVTLNGILSDILEFIRGKKGSNGASGSNEGDNPSTPSVSSTFKQVEDMLSSLKDPIADLPKVLTANTGAINALVEKLNESDKDYVFGPTGGHTKDFAAKQFATGGLADFTGPAWLDGTKSRPELVLNQQDTANFIALKDILAGVLDGKPSTGSKSNGDNYFDINISVDKLSEDYDVDQLADRIKTIIYDDATYRNVNSINLIR